MSNPVSRRSVINSIFLIAMMGFLAGASFASGVDHFIRGDWRSTMEFGLVPLLVLPIVLHARKILGQVA
jgi:hypothetical protein